MQGNYPYQGRPGANPSHQGAAGSSGSSSSYGYSLPSSSGSGWGGDSAPYHGDSMARDSYGSGAQFGGQSDFTSTHGNQGSYSPESYMMGSRGSDYSRGYESTPGSGSSPQAGMGTSLGRTMKRPSTGPDSHGKRVKKDNFSFGAGSSGECSGGGQSWGSGMPGFGRGGQQLQGGGGMPGNQTHMVEDLSGCTMEQLYLALQLVKTGLVGSTPPAGAVPGPGALMGRGQGNWANQAGLLQPGNQLRGPGYMNPGWGRGSGQKFNMAGGRGGKSQQVPVDNRLLSREERLKRLSQHLKQNDSKLDSDIQTLENAITATHLDLHTDFRWEEVLRHSSKVYFTGTLTVSGIFLARGVGGNKKEVKRDLYQQAVKNLKTMAVPQLTKIKDPGFNATKKQLEKSLGITETEEKETQSSTKTKPPSTQQPTFSSPPDSNLQSRIEALSTFLKSSDAKFENRICELTSAIKAAKCKLQQDVDFGEVRCGGLNYYTCTLMFEGLPMGHGSGHSKKLAKAKAYEKAYQALISKPLSQIMAGAPVDFDLPSDTPSSSSQSKDSLNKPVGAMSQQSEAMEVEIPDGASPTLVKFIQLRQKLAPQEPQLKDLVNAVDTATAQLSIAPMCIYSKPSTEHKSHCDLYLDELFIAFGDGNNRRESKLNAYSSAWEVLKTTSAEDVVANSRRLKPEDKTAVGVVDVCVKGQSSLQDSNMRQLQEMGVTDADLAQPLSSLVFMEHTEWVSDRRRHAYSILSKSATWCKMLLSWTIEPYHSFFKCEMELQEQPVGQAYARSKNEARSLAAADAIFKMYQTHPVVKVAPNKDDPLHWVEVDEVRRKVAELQEAAAPTEEPTEGLQEESVSPYFSQVIENYILEFKQKNSMDELIFGTGLLVPERREIQQLCKRHGLRSHNRHFQQMNYIVMYVQRNPGEIVAALKENPAACWKYSLEEAAQLPQHQEIQHHLLSQEKVDALIGPEASRQ